MTDMSDWTEEEKKEYLGILHQIAGGYNPTTDELLATSTHCKEALVDVYQETLYKKKKKETRWKRLIGVLHR